MASPRLGRSAASCALRRLLVAVVVTPATLERPCDFERVDGRTFGYIGLQSQGRPLVLTRLTEAWPARERWRTAAAFAALYGDVAGYARDHDQLELRDMDTNVAEYLAGASEVSTPAENLSESTAFFVNDYEDARLLDRVKEDYEPPPALRHIGALRVLSLEKPGAGVALHRHEASWQALVAGSKNWYLVDPSVEQVPLQSPCSFEGQDGLPHFAEFCTVNAGEVLFVPSNWWHATCTTSSEPSVAIGGVGSLMAWPPAVLAARRGDFQGVLKALGAAGGASAHVDSQEVPPGPGIFVGGERPLYLAAAFGHDDLVRGLLTRGAAPELPRRDGRTPLHEAARRGDLFILKRLLRAGAGVTTTDAAGNTALHHACAERGAPEVIQHLLEQGASAVAKRKDGRTALHVACRSHRNPVTVLRLLLHRGAAPAAVDAQRMTALMHCAAAGHAQGVGLLLRFGSAEVKSAVDAEGRDALGHALLGRGDEGVVQRLLAAGLRPGERAVANAVRLGLLAPVPLLVEHGANVSGAVVAAALGGHAQAVPLLARKLGADLNEVEDEGGARALHLAALGGHLGTVEALLAARADAGALDEDGLNALHYAATSSVQGGNSSARPRAPRAPRRRAVAEALVAVAGEGAASAAAAGGTTPLHIAAAVGDAELASWLVHDRGLADPGALNAQNETAADQAAQHGFSDLALLLRGWQRDKEAKPAAAEL